MFVLNLQRKLMAQGNVQWLFHAFKWEEWAHGLNPEPFKLVFEGPQGRQPRRLRGSWFSQGPIRKTEDTPSNILKRNFTQGIDYKGHGRTKTSRRDSETTKRLSEQEALPPPPITTTQGWRQREEAEVLEPRNWVHWRKLEPRWTCDGGGRDAWWRSNSGYPGLSCPLSSNLPLVPPSGWAQLEATWWFPGNCIALSHYRVREGQVMGPEQTIKWLAQMALRGGCCH